MLSIIKLSVFLSIVIIASGCGGSGDGSATTPETIPETTNITGVVIDDYLQNALVCVDINANGSCDSDEPTAHTGTQGEYTIADVATSISTQYPILVVATPGQTTDNGNAISGKYKLKAPVGKTVVTPLTTMAQYAIENNPAIDADMAATAIERSIGLVGEADVDIYADYLDATNTASTATKNKLHGVSKVVARTIGNNLSNIENDAAIAGETNVDNEVLRIVLQHVSGNLSTIAENVYTEIENNGSVTDNVADTLATNYGGTYNNINFSHDLTIQKTISNLDETATTQTVMTAGAGAPDSTAGFQVDYISLGANNVHVDNTYELNVDGVSWNGPFYQSARFKLDDTNSWVEIDEENNPAHRNTQSWQFNADGSGTLTQVNPSDSTRIIDQTKVTASVVSLQGEKLVDYIGDDARDYATCLTNNGNASATFTNVNSNAIRWTWVTQVGGYMLQPESTYGTPTLIDADNANAAFVDVDDMTNGTLVSLVHNFQHLRLNNDAEKTAQFYGTDNTGTTVIATSHWEKVVKGAIEIIIISKPLAVYDSLPISDTTHLLLSVDPNTNNVSFGGHTPTGTAEVVDWWDFNLTAINEYLTGCGFNTLN